MTKTEERAVGNIPIKIYTDYIASGGTFITAATVFLFLLS